MLQAMNRPQLNRHIASDVCADNISAKNHSSKEVQTMNMRSRIFPIKLLYSSVMSTIFSTQWETVQNNSIKLYKSTNHQNTSDQS